MQTDTFRAACEALLPRALDFLRALVAENSFTANLAGVDRNAELVAAAFAELGFTGEREPFVGSRRGHFADHLFLRTPAAADRPTLALISHLDTVFPPEEEARKDFRWRVEGRRIYGPGTNDIKGGTALAWLMLAAMRRSAPKLFAAANWIVALNSCEEEDSSDFAQACRRRLPAETRAALVFEGDDLREGAWTLVAARKGRATFTVRVEGRASHAGGGHANGINAIVALAEVVGRLAAITDYARGVTVNVGAIAGGTVVNRVPHEASATLEMRAHEPAAFDAAAAAILAHDGMATNGARVVVERQDVCGPWPANPGTEALLALWRSVAEADGATIVREERGGLSDGNVLWSWIPTIDGLGPKGANCHCSERSADGSKDAEWVDAESFVPKAVLNARAIAKLLKR